MYLTDNTILQGGKYKIVRVLGQGGFGITYEAEQVSLGRRVAVKEFFMKDLCNRDDATSQVSVPSVGSQELVERFKQKFIREAKMIAGFDNEQIVRIHDVFEENGTAYYVMEYLPGGSLADVVKREGSLPEVRAIGYIEKIAAALSYLHGQNILHLDVKPSNVLLTSSGNLKLIDFGISKHYDEAGSQTSSTPVGISKGYAPLEQYQQGGDISKFTPATDIYALGATLYYLVTGTVPPDASEVGEDGLPERPDSVSKGVYDAICTAMSFRRKDRPQNVEVFLGLIKSEPVVEGRSSATPIVNDEETTLIFTDGMNPKVNHASVRSTDECVAVHEYVDLGLPSGLKWATCNVGASSPEEYGSYFAWGEVSPKSGQYDWETYKWSNGSGANLTKYNNMSSNGRADNKDRLDLTDDAAYNNLGRRWRVPTNREFEELLSHTTYEWTTLNGHMGCKLTSKINGKSIFLPAAGYRAHDGLNAVDSYGGYWSSSLCDHNSKYAWHLISSACETRMSKLCLRYMGYTIRPVTE